MILFDFIIGAFGGAAYMQYTLYSRVDEVSSNKLSYLIHVSTLRLKPAEKPTCVKHLTARTHPNRRVFPIMAHEFHFEVISKSKTEPRTTIGKV
jgi:hypothetical protein